MADNIDMRGSGTGRFGPASSSGDCFATPSCGVFSNIFPNSDARGIRVVGISVDPPEINRRQSQKLGYTFPLLSDPNAQVIRRYDVLHPGAGPKGADVARPAEFLIDSSRVVRWVTLLTTSPRARGRSKSSVPSMEWGPPRSD